MLHTMSLAGVVAYDMYLEVAEGKLDQTWKDENSVDFWTFRDLLSNQMVKYNPTHCKYAGGTNMRPAKEQNKATRDNSKDGTRGKIGGGISRGGSIVQLCKKKSKYRRGANSRLCGNLT